MQWISYWGPEIVEQRIALGHEDDTWRSEQIEWGWWDAHSTLTTTLWAVLYTNKSQIKDKSDVIETLKDVDPIRSVDILECDVQKFRVFD